MAHVYGAGLGKMAPLVFRLISKMPWSRLKEEKDSLMQEMNKDDLTTFEQTSRLENDYHADDKQDERSRDEKAGTKYSWPGRYHASSYHCTFGLVTNHARRRFGDVFQRSLAAVFLVGCLRRAGYFGVSQPDRDDLLFLSSLALRHLQACSCNAYELSELQVAEGRGDCIQVGGAVYPSVSLTNHSCHPNTTRYTVGTACVLTATRHLAKGEEVLDNYGDHFCSKSSAERQDSLQQHYHFLCSCTACLQGWPQYSEQPYLQLRDGKQPRDLKERLAKLERGKALVKDGNMAEAIPLLEQQQRLVDEHLTMPCKHGSEVQALLRYAYGSRGNTNTM